MRLLLALAIVVTILAVIGCGGSDESAATTEPNGATSVPPTLTPIPTATVAPTFTLAPTATGTPEATATIPARTPTPAPDAADCPIGQPMQNVPSDAPPNIFLGTASIDGQVVPNGTNVTSCIDGEPVAYSLVTDGQFLVTIQQQSAALNGKEVKFSVDGLDAKETAVWAVGGAVLIDLSAER